MLMVSYAMCRDEFRMVEDPQEMVGAAGPEVEHT